MEISVYTKYTIAALIVGIGMVIVGTMLFGDVLFKSSEIVCTQEAKVCPDGTAVGRFGSLCEFALCPSLEVIATTSTDEKIIVPVIPAPAACTKEAKICSDGSTVGRIAPSCNFAQCPKIPPPPDTSLFATVVGIVTVGPVCPVMSNPPEPECNDRPLATELVVRSSNLLYEVATVTSNKDGEFTVNVPAGSYVITQTDGAPIFPRCIQSEIFTVEARSTTKINILCDTGIR